MNFYRYFASQLYGRTWHGHADSIDPRCFGDKKARRIGRKRARKRIALLDLKDDGAEAARRDREGSR